MSGETPRLAHKEVTLDLLVHSADRLNVAALIDRSRDRDALIDGELPEAGEHRVQLGARGAVAVDAAVRLLEGQPRGERQWLPLPVFPQEVAPEGGHALATAWPREKGLQLAL